MQIRCLPLGPAYSTSGDSTGSEMVRIVQTPQLIVMLNPDLTYRQIWMDGRALEPDPNPSWMGYSVGRWEGDTLVVDSFGFHTGTWLDRDGNTHSEKLRLTERYRRPNFGGLEVEVTLSDPEAYTRPWTVKVSAQFTADTEMLEWVCNEGASRSLEPLGGHGVGRSEERNPGRSADPVAICGDLRRAAAVLERRADRRCCCRLRPHGRHHRGERQARWQHGRQR